ncbi:DUF2842 domain-containing protein [Paracoccus aerodenitrificans]|uniref:DUF2842 domain-containing protein n=1 Tax=Paracoccus aerodenitrificans TaxID=3017781 RepID=UPI0022F0077F|nr:DUF2842 domain-containing protein [Paracoccus aerodenitrificans]WBU65400.1 DUF2842 domain-containing protein [Paracoccus aerodenitrificans]
MELKTRKRLALLILLLGLPGYIIVAWVLLAWLNDSFGRMPVWAELLVFVALGVVWILPFKRVFTGIGRGED